MSARRMRGKRQRSSGGFIPPTTKIKTDVGVLAEVEKQSRSQSGQAASGELRMPQLAPRGASKHPSMRERGGVHAGDVIRTYEITSEGAAIARQV
jgi:hypothetical protein